MKKYIIGKSRIILIAAAILVVCAAAFVGSTQIAMGAEENKTISQESTYAENAADSGEAAGNSVPEFITEDDAVGAFMWVASNIFEKNIDESTLTATFEAAHNLVDDNGIAYYTVHDNWQVQNSDYHCWIDAVTGDVLEFRVLTDNYPGESISEGDFNKDFVYNIYNDPDNVYVTAARDIVETKLSEGRKIENIEVDGIQFAWDDDKYDDDHNASGTIQVDCHVYMDSGRFYTLSFWGTDQIVLKIFSTYPSKQACQWGYFYEENASDYPASPVPSGWQTAPGITGGYVAPGSTPEPMPTPGN
jgi:hypothetical protein